MLPILQIGPLSVQTAGLVLLAGLWIGLEAAERSAHRHHIQPALLYNLVLIALAAGVVGGRLLYAMQYPSAFAANPLALISLNPGLFDWTAAIATGALAAAIYAKGKAAPLTQVLDAITPLLAIMAAALALANLATGSGFGAPTQVPWAIELWGDRRHPAQVYELLAALVIFAFIWSGQRRGWFPRPGQTFLSFIALSAGARLFLEAFRGDSTLIGGSIRSAQAAAWLVLALALWGLGRLRRHAAEKTLIREENEPVG